MNPDKVSSKHDDIGWKFGFHLGIAGAVLILVRSFLQWQYLPFPVSFQAIFTMLPSVLVCGKGPNFCWVTLNLLMLVISIPTFGYVTLFLTKKVRKVGRLYLFLNSLYTPITNYFVLTGIVFSMLIILISSNNEYYFQNNELVHILTFPRNIISLPFLLFGLCDLWSPCSIYRPFGDAALLIVYALIGWGISKVIQKILPRK